MTKKEIAGLVVLATVLVAARWYVNARWGGNMEHDHPLLMAILPTVGLAGALVGLHFLRGKRQ